MAALAADLGVGRTTGAREIVYEIALVWPEILTGEADREELSGQPSLEDEAWWAWILGTGLLADLRARGMDPLLDCTTSDTPDAQVEWTSPAAIIQAVNRLSEALVAEPEFANAVLAEYQRYAELEGRVGDPAASFRSDLEGLRALAKWATARGRDKVIFEINF
jgi:hypothetical protein